MIKKSVLTFYLFLSSFLAFGQGVNNFWIMGYGSQFGPPYGGTNIDFISGSPNIYYVNRQMDMRITNANISDSQGNILFYCNGYYIADATGDTMFNGSGLNPSWYTSQYPEGLSIPQANLIIHKPNSSNIYYLFHSTVDDPPNTTAWYLYLTTIDMNLNGGLGAVISKNQILINDTLNIGKINAVKHANGRDWWVVCHKAFSNKYYFFLVTPDNIFGPYSQNIGIVRPRDNGEITFSPDGKRFAYYYPMHGLEIFDFDRCSGMLSNPTFISINDSALSGGVAFSPNSNVLYASSTYYVYQFDVTAANIASTQYTAAVWDSFYSPGPPFATLFNLSQLAPDGKIYISTGNGTDYLHVVNAPDSLGSACDLIQHGVQLPSYCFNSLPNHPNYFLGADTTSICDSIPLGVSLNEFLFELHCYPNPVSNNILSINYHLPDNCSGKLEIYDIDGKNVYATFLPKWSTFQRIQLPKLSSGIYALQISSDKYKTVKKIIIE
jgi:hypothetical protein